METNRDLPITTEGTLTRAHSLTGNLWWLLPPAAALFYPQAVRTLYVTGKLLHREGGSGGAVVWIVIVVAAALVYSVPAAGIVVAYLLGRQERTSSWEVMVRRLAHLAVASPPLFVLIGVVFFLTYPSRSLASLATGVREFVKVAIFPRVIQTGKPFAHNYAVRSGPAWRRALRGAVDAHLCDGDRHRGRGPERADSPGDTVGRDRRHLVSE